MKSNIFLFGYGRLGHTIVEVLKDTSFHFQVIESSSSRYDQAQENGYDTIYLDITKDEELEMLAVKAEDYLICVMDDEHLNVFLILSLRALFPKTTILAISTSIHATQKMKMAGATKVIDLYQVSANRIHNILKKPVATKLLDDFLIREDGISFKEMVIPVHSYLVGKLVNNIDFQQHGLIVIGFINMSYSRKFIFITSGLNHQLNPGDMIVCIGEYEKLKAFEQYIKRSQK